MICAQELGIKIMAKQNQGNSGGTPQLYILLWMSFLIVVISNAQISAESEKEFAKVSYRIVIL